MRCKSWVVVALTAVSSSAEAGVVVYRAGEQDFADGSGPIWVEQAVAVGANEAAPFDGTVFGDDRSRKFGKVAFAYRFAAPDTAFDAVLTLGLIGLDSTPGSGPSVKLLLDGVEQPNDAFAGVSSASYRSSASVVSVPVPAALLADGRLDVVVKAFRRSPGYPGNAIEADFSTLAVPMLERPASTPPPIISPPVVLPPGDPSGPPSGGPGTGGDSGTPGEPPGGGGSGGTGGTPMPAVPLPPACYAGGIGLLIAWWKRRSFRTDMATSQGI